MRLDTILTKSSYKLPNRWASLSQRDMKMHMISHVNSKCSDEEREIFMSKLAYYSDLQYGNLCVRLAKREDKKANRS